MIRPLTFRGFSSRLAVFCRQRQSRWFSKWEDDELTNDVLTPLVDQTCDEASAFAHIDVFTTATFGGFSFGAPMLFGARIEIVWHNMKRSWGGSQGVRTLSRNPIVGNGMVDVGVPAVSKTQSKTVHKPQANLWSS